MISDDHDFCDECPGCQPAIIDPETGKLMADDHPTAIEINKWWKTKTTYLERKAMIIVWRNRKQPIEERWRAIKAMARMKTEIEAS